ncbi:MAG: hypothetical protein WC998_09680 [Candidatus Paceibacterota bacterium]|jgi:hypothetical protein
MATLAAFTLFAGVAGIALAVVSVAAVDDIKRTGLSSQVLAGIAWAFSALLLLAAAMTFVKLFVGVMMASVAL